MISVFLVCHVDFQASNCFVVLGSSFGDEGKAKIVDFLSDKFDYVVRYQGGNNAGHTVYLAKDVRHVFRVIPSGIVNAKAIIAHGVVVNPEKLIEEIDACSKITSLENRLFISDHAHVIFDWSISLDHLIEKIRDDNKVGSTGNGIGPSYALKSLRLNSRIKDLMDKESLRQNFTYVFNLLNPIFKNYGYSEFDVDRCVEKYWNLGQQIKPFLVNTTLLMHKEINNNKKFLFEGSQGLLLDLDMGTYPFVTSSHIVGDLISGTGLPISFFHENLFGIVKAYFSRVGEGEFPTEISSPELSGLIRTKGREYGSGTGRPRRIGWLDLVCVKHAISFSGIKKIALTLVDVLNGFSEVKVCFDYLDSEGKSVDWNFRNENITPVYKTFPGWNDDYSLVKTYLDLSIELRTFIEFIEKHLEVNVGIISYGPLKSDILVVKKESEC